MSTSTTAGVGGVDSLATAGGRVVQAATVVTGVALVAESVASVFIDSHVGYHGLSSVLNAALLVATVGFARAGRTTLGWTGVVGGWATALMALLATAGGAWAALVEGFSSAESPGAVEGISHTAVIAAFLFLVPLGLGLRKLTQAGLVIAGSSASLVVMVLAGLDQPEVFLLPEAVLGLGWLLLGRVLRTAATTKPPAHR